MLLLARFLTILAAFSIFSNEIPAVDINIVSMMINCTPRMHAPSRGIKGLTKLGVTGSTDYPARDAPNLNCQRRTGFQNHRVTSGTMSSCVIASCSLNVMPSLLIPHVLASLSLSLVASTGNCDSYRTRFSNALQVGQACIVRIHFRSKQNTRTPIASRSNREGFIVIELLLLLEHFCVLYLYV